MQAIILAAGMGNRLGKYTQNNTKCMLEINGKKLIHRALHALETNGIQKCILVVGYQKQNVIDLIGSQFGKMKIEYISNDVYDKTNNIYSLYLAKDNLLEDDTLLLESDLIFEDRIISDLLQNKEPSLAVVAKHEAWMDGTVVQIDSENVITQFVPKNFFNYKDIDSYYKTVNIYKFSKEYLRDSYVPFLEAYSKAMGNNEYYEQVLRVVTTLEKNELKALCLSDHKWYEIDDIQDKDIAEVLFEDNPDIKLNRMEKRYGGYWRFNGMKDFCYLVNPYFPNSAMLNEMKHNFYDLLSQYPSGLNIQNLLAGKMFSVDEKHILVGNGAAELIRSLDSVLKGSVGIVYPSFNEYHESLPSHEIISFYPKDISYTIDDLLKWSTECNTLLLINPDNPSGNFIPAKDVLRLLNTMKENNKTLVLDESFIDFCSYGKEASVFTQEVLDTYKNLIIIKSISKSYGVPGIRLGVLACSNPEIIIQVRKKLSIWNINSFGEFFLQIIGKYKKDYETACKKIISERERFYSLLTKTGIFKVYNSQANYFLCKITTSISARELTKKLLNEKNLFMKDLTGKKGIEGSQYIRVAVRNSEDNDSFIEAIQTI